MAIQVLKLFMQLIFIWQISHETIDAAYNSCKVDLVSLHLSPVLYKHLVPEWMVRNQNEMLCLRTYQAFKCQMMFLDTRQLGQG